MNYLFIKKLTCNFVLPVCFVLLFGCNKHIDIDPPANSITSETVFASNTSAMAAITAIYQKMDPTSASSNFPVSGTTSISNGLGMAADELTLYSNSSLLNSYYQNSWSSSSNGASNPYNWNSLYTWVYGVNAVIEGLNNSSNLSDSIKQQVYGEAKFMRAFFYFYLTNLYGDVPLALSTDYRINSKLSRTAQTTVYQQIISDLKEAQIKLPNHFVDYQGLPVTARIRPNKFAASALLARTYLYLNRYDSAEIEASDVIGSSIFSLVTISSGTSNVFAMNSKEAIWQIQGGVTNNVYDPRFLVLTSTPGTGNFIVALSNNFLLSSFESNDKRKSYWIGSYTAPSTGTTYYYPYKYKVNTANAPSSEFFMVMRLAEQYLIRAEARAQQGNLTGAISDLNIIRQRAGLPTLNSATMNQSQVLDAVMQERRVELFCEWGHRWFDLKRTGHLDATMGGVAGVCQAKGGIWSSYKALMPLPLNELNLNKNLVQNPGY